MLPEWLRSGLRDSSDGEVTAPPPPKCSLKMLPVPPWVTASRGSLPRLTRATATGVGRAAPTPVAAARRARHPRAADAVGSAAASSGCYGSGTRR